MKKLLTIALIIGLMGAFPIYTQAIGVSKIPAPSSTVSLPVTTSNGTISVPQDSVQSSSFSGTNATTIPVVRDEEENETTNTQNEYTEETTENTNGVVPLHLLNQQSKNIEPVEITLDALIILINILINHGYASLLIDMIPYLILAY